MCHVTCDKQHCKTIAMEDHAHARLMRRFWVVCDELDLVNRSSVDN